MSWVPKHVGFQEMPCPQGHTVSTEEEKGFLLDQLRYQTHVSFYSGNKQTHAVSD
jgi:hypothetical protein